MFRNFFRAILSIFGLARRDDPAPTHKPKPGATELKDGADMSGAVNAGDTPRANSAVKDGDRTFLRDRRKRRND